jgi:hypothetical protein
MTDDVSRLRRLRRTALKTRALAAVLRDNDERRQSFIDRGMVLSWRLARITTGRLRSHPNPAFHRDQSRFESFQDGMGAIVEGLKARKAERRVQAFTTQLKFLSRELDNTRSLTLTPDLSDALGRAQWQMREILKQGGLSRAQEVKRIELRPAEAAEQASSPYLAL